jgi:hypothetical protein
MEQLRVFCIWIRSRVSFWHPLFSFCRCHIPYVCIYLPFSLHRNLFNHRTQLELWVTDLFSSSRFLHYITVYQFLQLQLSSATLCISHLQHGFVLLLHMFSLPLLKFFFTSFSTVGHLLILVHLGQFAVPLVGVVSSVATVQPRAVMCVGDTTLTHHFTDIVRTETRVV